jgi:hypothetical protein
MAGITHSAHYGIQSPWCRTGVAYRYRYVTYTTSQKTEGDTTRMSLSYEIPAICAVSTVASTVNEIFAGDSGSLAAVK